MVEDKRKRKPRTSIPETFIHYAWIIEKLQDKKMDYFDFCKHVNEPKYETNLKYEAIITRLSKEKYKYMLEMAEKARKQFEERLNPDSKFYKRYELYWKIRNMDFKNDNDSLEKVKAELGKEGLEKIIRYAGNLADNRLAICSILDMEHKSVCDMLIKNFGEKNYNKLKELEDLSKYHGTVLFQKLLSLAEKSDCSIEKIDRSLRTEIEYPEEFFHTKDHDFLAAESILRHFLSLLTSRVNPLSTLMSERTHAVWTIIPVINFLALPYMDELDVRWIESTHRQTGKTKWDGIICSKNTDDIVCLMEFAGGNTPKDEKNHKKQNEDELKLYKGIFRLPKKDRSQFPNHRVFVIRTMGSKAFFESVCVRYDIWVRTQHFSLEWPKDANGFKEFSRQLPKLMSFRLALLETAGYFSKIPKIKEEK